MNTSTTLKTLQEILDNKTFPSIRNDLVRAALISDLDMMNNLYSQKFSFHKPLYTYEIYNEIELSNPYEITFNNLNTIKNIYQKMISFLIFQETNETIDIEIHKLESVIQLITKTQTKMKKF